MCKNGGRTQQRQDEIFPNHHYFEINLALELIKLKVLQIQIFVQTTLSLS